MPGPNKPSLEQFGGGQHGDPSLHGPITGLVALSIPSLGAKTKAEAALPRPRARYIGWDAFVGPP